MIDINKVKPVPRVARKAAELLDELDPNLHGGCYVDISTGTMHINLVEGREGAIGLGPIDGVVYHVVKHSYAVLDMARNAILLNNKSGVMSSAGIDTRTNKLTLNVLEDSLQKHVIPMNAVAGDDMFEITAKKQGYGKETTQRQENKAVSDESAMAAVPYMRTRNGEEWYPGYLSSPSLCAGITYRSGNENKFGWISSTHGDGLSQRANYVISTSPYSIDVGYVRYVNNTSTKCDFTIIERTNTNVGATDLSTGGICTNLFGGLPRIGDLMYLCGRVSGSKWSTCTDNNVTCILGTKTKIEFIEVGTAIQGGDSGGPMLWWTDSTQMSLVGIIGGTDNITTVGMRANNARDDFNFDICQFW